MEGCKNVCDGLAVCFGVACVIDHACDHVFVFSAFDAADLFEALELLYDVVNVCSSFNTLDRLDFFLYRFADCLPLRC